MPTGKKYVAPPPPAPDPQDLEFEAYRNADAVHAAYESGWYCDNCGAPVRFEWKSCPMCGTTKAAQVRKTPFKFDEAKAKRNPPAPPVAETVTVTEVPKETKA